MKDQKRKQVKTAEKKRVKPTPKRSTGATKVAPRKNLSEKLIIFKRGFKIGLVFSFLVLAGVGVIHLKPVESLKKMTHKPISELQIDGEFLYLSKEKAQNMAMAFIDDGLLNADLKTIKNEFEKVPWVDSVSVARKWPDILQIQVVEQQPIARWGEKGFLNMRGEIVSVEQAHLLDNLPKLSGEDRHASEITQQFLQFGKITAGLGDGLASLELSKTKNWQIELSSGLVVKLGKEGTLEKLQLIRSAKEGVLRDQFSNIEAIDMRYRSGFAIEWKEQNNEQVALVSSQKQMTSTN